MGQCHKIFSVGFLHQTVSSGSIRGILGWFRIWSSFGSSYSKKFKTRRCNLHRGINSQPNECQQQLLKKQSFKKQTTGEQYYKIAYDSNLDSFQSIISTKFNQIINRPRVTLMGPGETVWCKSQDWKNLVALSH